MSKVFASLALLALSSVANAHVAAWVKGMYCLGGPNPSVDDADTDTAVVPLWNLTKTDWWFQHDRGCDRAPPANGDILELPAGRSITVELAHNRGQTTLSFDGRNTSDWPDGKQHPDNWSGIGNPPGCLIDDGALHTNNESMAAGTAFAISYQSDLSHVTMENLVVFTVTPQTPWKRLATYDVPADLPPCPDGGCHCAWLWAPKGCGEPNMYMAGYKCNVTGSTSTKTVAAGQVPAYCGDGSPCVQGAKQMLAFNQLDGNNVKYPSNGDFVYYGEGWGWQAGAQNDIFK